MLHKLFFYLVFNVLSNNHRNLLKLGLSCGEVNTCPSYDVVQSSPQLLQSSEVIMGLLFLLFLIQNPRISTPFQNANLRRL